MHKHLSIFNTRHYSTLGVLIAFIFLGTVLFSFATSQDSKTSAVAVHVNIPHELVFYELSPLGESGGYMVPASCPSGYHESGPHRKSVVDHPGNKTYIGERITTWSSPCAVIPPIPPTPPPVTPPPPPVTPPPTPPTPPPVTPPSPPVTPPPTTVTPPPVYTPPPPPPPTPTLSFSASPTSVALGGASTLTWSASNVTSCTASGAWSGSKAASGSQSTGALTTTPNTYTLTCTGPYGSVSNTVTVTIPAPTATLQVRVNGGAWTTTSQIIESTDEVNLQWGSTNASTCNASGFNTAGATSGIATNVDEPVPGTTKTYTVQCPGASGTSQASASVSVTTRSRLPTLTPSSSIVTSGSTATLVYDLNGNASCTFSASDSTLNNVTVTTNGAKSTGAITQQTAYTLTCTGGSATTIINIEGNIQEQ